MSSPLLIKTHPSIDTMPPKGTKPTSDELLAQFDNLGIDQSEKGAKPAQTPTDNAKSQEDVLAELDNLAVQRPSSGPGTPRLSADKPRSSTRSPRPSATLERTEEKPRPSEEGRSSRAGTKPEQPKVEEDEAPQQTQEQGGGWWGGIFATASAAMKQAEAAVKEIQNNEEAQRWAQQVKGNVGALRDLGMSTSTSWGYKLQYTFQHQSDIPALTFIL